MIVPIHIRTNQPSIAYGYDNNGNRLNQTSDQFGNVTCTYDEENRLTQEIRDGVTYVYGYDKNGNMVSRNGETLSYDYANRLQTYSGPNGTWNYVYAPTGERIAKINGSTSQWFMHDGPDVIADYQRIEASPATYHLTASYVNGLGIDSKIARITPDAQPTTHYYVNDAWTRGQTPDFRNKDLLSIQGIISQIS